MTRAARTTSRARGVAANLSHRAHYGSHDQADSEGDTAEDAPGSSRRTSLQDQERAARADGDARTLAEDAFAAVLRVVELA
jgi:hypothetical protein